jgi:hypothetical protein
MSSSEHKEFKATYDIMIYPLVVSRSNLVLNPTERVQVLIVKLSVKYRYLKNLHKHT